MRTEMRQSSVVSDLGLHCLLRSQIWDARHEWVKNKFERNKFIFKKFKESFLWTVATLIANFVRIICLG